MLASFLRTLLEKFLLSIFGVGFRLPEGKASVSSSSVRGAILLALGGGLIGFELLTEPGLVQAYLPMLAAIDPKALLAGVLAILLGLVQYLVGMRKAIGGGGK